MFQLLKKYRKGVSPVIAIVLLIALTVAAAAVIWTLTSGILDDASGNTLVVSNSASATNTSTTLVVKVTLRSNSITTLSDNTAKTTIITAPGTVPTVTLIDIAPSKTLQSGDTAVTITFTALANDWVPGSYLVSLSWAGEGDDPKLLEISATLN